ncbi:MAG: DUF3341 domain-containing protein [Candidatus Hydrogenedentes bacterium]|nr:DUF3341 domain-containing protein [Candidatus Hydrogenedentota bacterium]
MGQLGIVAEFTSPEDLLVAAQKVYDEGYKQIDAFAPFPVDGLAEAIGFKKTRLPLIILCGGLTGACTAFGFQYWASAVYYPYNIGGRPFFSWPAFIPITFELTVLFASFAAVFGMILLNGLPKPYHPVFNSERFAKHATSDGFFLSVETSDPKFDMETTCALLSGLGATHVEAVAQ